MSQRLAAADFCIRSSIMFDAAILSPQIHCTPVPSSGAGGAVAGGGDAGLPQVGAVGKKKKEVEKVAGGGGPKMTSRDAIASIKQDQNLRGPLFQYMTGRDSVLPMFFAYCHTYLGAPLWFDARNNAHGLHIPTPDEQRAISAGAGREFLDHLNRITARDVFGKSIGQYRIDPNTRGHQLFADLWALLTQPQKDYISNPRNEAKVPVASELTPEDHPFKKFLRLFPIPGHVHILERVCGRLTESHADTAVFENMLTGAAQILICPTKRWYVRITQANGRPNGRPVYAEISDSGSIFALKRGPQASKVEQNSDLCDDTIARTNCPFYASGNPQAIIDKWNVDHPGPDNVVTSAVSARCDNNRFTLYHYSGLKMVFSVKDGRAHFITVMRAGVESFSQWRTTHNAN
jgi:hypothetical protein